jgi:hypothetical protein
MYVDLTGHLTPEYVKAWAWANNVSDHPIHDRVTLAYNAVKERLRLEGEQYVENIIEAYATHLKYAPKGAK